MDLFIAGNVQTVLNGHVTCETLQPVLLNKMPYALGGAAIPNKPVISLGETAVYEGVGHIFTINEAHVEKRTLNAAFLMGIERKPKEFLRITKKQLIDTLYRTLVKTYPMGFAIVGTAMFSKLSVAYLKLSPIYGENVNILHDKYWNREELCNCEVKLFGVVLTNPDARAFYNNPNEKGNQTLSSHTHVLIPSVRHLLTDSELVSGSFWIEQIDRIQTLSSPH